MCKCQRSNYHSSWDTTLWQADRRTAVSVIECQFTLFIQNLTYLPNKKVKQRSLTNFTNKYTNKTNTNLGQSQKLIKSGKVAIVYELKYGQSADDVQHEPLVARLLGRRLRECYGHTYEICTYILNCTVICYNCLVVFLFFCLH